MYFQISIFRLAVSSNQTRPDRESFLPWGTEQNNCLLWTTHSQKGKGTDDPCVPAYSSQIYQICHSTSKGIEVQRVRIYTNWVPFSWKEISKVGRNHSRVNLPSSPPYWKIVISGPPRPVRHEWSSELAQIFEAICVTYTDTYTHDAGRQHE